MEINGVAFKEPTNGTSSGQSLADTFDTFLALLTTQLQNQDPLDPLDSNQFTEQLVQFAGVEQSINTNKKLDQIVQLQTSSQLNGAVGYIGKTAEVISDQLVLADGAARISYGIDGNAKDTTIAIVDEAGKTVRTIIGETAAGRHEFVWDGRDSHGALQPDGVYGFAVTAVDDKDKTIDTLTATIGRVTGVEIVEGALTLNLGPLGVPFDAVFAVRQEETSL